MLPRTTRSWSNIGKFTRLTSPIAVACVSWSITWTSADAQRTIFMVLCAQTQMTDIDILSLHCKSDSLVVRNATQLDRKHVVILRARCACSCHFASNMVGFGPLLMTGRSGQSDHSGKTASTIDTQAPCTGHLNPETHAAMWPNATSKFFNDEHADTKLFDVLWPPDSATKVSLVVGSADGVPRASWSAAHSLCSVRSFLLVACSMVARTLVAHDRCGTKLTFDALTQKHVRTLHAHPNSVIFTNLSESL